MDNVNESGSGDIPCRHTSTEPNLWLEGRQNRALSNIDTGLESLTLQTLLTHNTKISDSMTSLIQTLTWNQTPSVIPPGKHRKDGGETFVQFLTHFEDYCARAYPGSSEGMLPLLGSWRDLRYKFIRP
ncbi:UNVERIFIED_CONTAM: hypothetical protein RMT77_013731 [Armadillidium vulgare]